MTGDRHPTRVIIGNGKSREGFDLTLLNNFDVVTYGCNAVHRDYAPNYLVAMDGGIIEEIAHSGIARPGRGETILRVPHWRDQFEFEHYRSRGLHGFPPRSNVGAVAVEMAISDGVSPGQQLWLLGMDSLFDVQTTSPMGNVYAGTKNYTRSTAATISDVVGRRRHFQWLFKKHPKIEFRLVISDEEWPLMCEEFMEVPNVVETTYEAFCEALDI